MFRMRSSFVFGIAAMARRSVLISGLVISPTLLLTSAMTFLILTRR